MNKKILISKTINEVRIALLGGDEIRDYLVTIEDPQQSNQPSIGNIYLAKVTKVLPGLQIAFVDIGDSSRSGFLGLNDADINSRNSTKTPPPKIEKILRKNDIVLVQITREPISSKGYRVTRHLSFAGHYLVYLPETNYMGISQRIEDMNERERLKNILEEIKDSTGGLIARTTSEKQNKETLENDYKILNKTWRDVKQKIKKQKNPKSIYQELSFIEKTLRDIVDDKVETIYVDDHDSYITVKKFIKTYLPKLKITVLHFDEDISLFEYHKIEKKIKHALSNKIYLKSGGSIHIEQTEALVSIDVNTGKLTNKKTPEENILGANLEAAKEIATQLILRNCGGIIVIDFIDMTEIENQKQVYQAFADALKKDRAKTNIFPFSNLGLVEMTRKRTRDNLLNTLCEPCDYCHGVGKVKSTNTVCYEIIRDIEKMLKKENMKKVTILSHPKVSAELLSNSQGYIKDLEEKYCTSISIQDEDFHLHSQYKLY